MGGGQKDELTASLRALPNADNKYSWEFKFKFKPGLTDVSNCFTKCSLLTTINPHLFDCFPNIQCFNECFYGCKSLETLPVYGPSSIPLWEIPGATGDGCFWGCTKLPNLQEMPYDWRKYHGYS